MRVTTDDSPQSDSWVAHLDSVSVVLDGRPVLEGISLQAHAGEVMALAGHNGSGKSTLLGVIAGTQPHGAGSVTRRGRVAFVVQHSQVPHSLPLTVRDTVAMGRWSVRGSWRPFDRSDTALVRECIAALGLSGLERRPLSSLSGGQRQRALVAQGLAQRADILLLDEPTAGLDDHARELIDLAIAREVRRGVAVVHATHDHDVMRQADRLVRLHGGTFVRPEDSAEKIAPRWRLEQG